MDWTEDESMEYTQSKMDDLLLKNWESITKDGVVNLVDKTENKNDEIQGGSGIMVSNEYLVEERKSKEAKKRGRDEKKLKQN